MRAEPRGTLVRAIAIAIAIMPTFAYFPAKLLNIYVKIRAHFLLTFKVQRFQFKT